MAVLWLLTMIPALFFAVKQLHETRVIDQYLAENDLLGLPLEKSSAIAVSDVVRRDFNTDKKTFVALKMGNRPFLREDTTFLLKYREGVCGEGTRVIVNLLRRLGFDATRVTLYNKELVPAHTLVSVVVDGQEFFVDSINSPADTTRVLKEHDISSDQFSLLHYSDDIAVRKQFAKLDHAQGKPAAYQRFLDYFWLYSYEATPYAKLLTRLGLDVRVFNFQRPVSILSSVAEKPNALLAAVSVLLSLITVLLLHVSGLVKRYTL